MTDSVIVLSIMSNLFTLTLLNIATPLMCHSKEAKGLYSLVLGTFQLSTYTFNALKKKQTKSQEAGKLDC